jgi:ABC-type antimicrobial peptide transport system permease subunit
MGYFAPIVVVQKEGRLATYAKDRESRDLDMIEWTNQVSLALGLDMKGTFTLPVNAFMRGTDIPQSFLNQILIGMVVILLLHSMLVIYSLLLSNTEEKTYEYGMLRALGLRHKSLIQLLTIQALFFSAPGIVLGLFLAFLLNTVVSYYAADYTGTEIDVALGWTPVLVGISLGLLMPIIANIAPIRRALSRTLRDALDVYHQKFNETVVKIVRLEEMGVSVEQTVWSVMMIIFGFGLLYVVPFAFRYQYWGIFLGLINATLLGMVLGLATVASILQGKIEKLMLHALMWRGARRLKVVVRKALSAHKDRNRKTALMFTTAVAFVIFAAAIFQIQTVSVGDNIRLLSGSDIFIQSLEYTQPLDEDAMRDFLDTHKKDPNSGIVDFTFFSFKMYYLPGVTATYVSNIAGTPDGSVDIHGVEENMLSSSYDQYLMLSAIDQHFSYAKTPHGKDDIVRSLYTDAGKAVTAWDKGLKIPPIVGSGKLINITEYAQRHPSYFPDVPASDFPYYINQDLNVTYTEYIDAIVETAQNGLQMYIDQPMQINVRFRITPTAVQTRLKYLAKPRAFASKFPALFFTWLKVLARTRLPIIISMDSFNKIAHQVYDARMAAMKANPQLKVPNDWTEKPPAKPYKAKLLVKLKDGVTRDQREFVINGLKNFIKHNRVLVSDTAELVGATVLATQLLMLFFYVVTAIAMLLCFFVLWISFTSNVNENSWEFGVLRAIGLNVWQVMSVYMFEALAIILTSVIMATIIGVVVAFTLALQYALFNQTDVQIYFPMLLFIFLLICSFAVSIIGSYLPSRRFASKEIAHTIKGI